MQRTYGGGLKADIRLYLEKTYEQIDFIDEEGYVLSKLTKFKPYLTLFYQATKNNNFRLYSGVEMRNCDICGRVLTHLVSLIVGLCPICAERTEMDYRFCDI